MGNSRSNAPGGTAEATIPRLISGVLERLELPVPAADVSDCLRCDEAAAYIRDFARLDSQ